MIDLNVNAINRTIPADAWAYRYRARLVTLHDGDTARVDIDLGFTVEMKNVQIRFDGYNAPEVTGPQKSQGVAARDFLEQLIAASDNLLYLQTQRLVIMSITRYVASVYLKGANGLLIPVAETMKLAGHDVPRVKSTIKNFGATFYDSSSGERVDAAFDTIVDAYVNRR
jgi:endonuclease YncB( thermonuclease family)